MRCFLTKLTGDGAACSGQTENISRTGMRIRLSRETPCNGYGRTGEYVRVDVELPRLGMSQQRCLSCQGTVIWRKDLDSQETVLGLAVSQMEFKDMPGRYFQNELDLPEGAQQVLQ